MTEGLGARARGFGAAILRFARGRTYAEGNFGFRVLRSGILSLAFGFRAFGFGLKSGGSWLDDM